MKTDDDSLERLKIEIDEAKRMQAKLSKPASPMLMQMKEKRIFSIKKEGGLFRFREECDEWFYRHLTKHEVLDLCREMIAFVSK